MLGWAMLRSSKKSGYSIVEVLCAITILSITFTGLITLELSNLKLKKYNEEIIRYTYVLDALKQEIMFNCSYDDVKNVFNSNRKFIAEENLTLERIKNLSLNELFDASVNTNNAYLSMTVTDEDILKIDLELHLKLQRKENLIKCEFYKGKYI